RAPSISPSAASAASTRRRGIRRRSPAGSRPARWRSSRSWFDPVGNGQRVAIGVPAAAERLGQADEGAGALRFGADLRIARREQLVFGCKQVAEIGQPGLILAAGKESRIARCLERLAEQRDALIGFP